VVQDQLDDATSESIKETLDSVVKPLVEEEEEKGETYGEDEENEDVMNVDKMAEEQPEEERREEVVVQERVTPMSSTCYVALPSDMRECGSLRRSGRDGSLIDEKPILDLGHGQVAALDIKASKASDFADVEEEDAEEILSSVLPAVSASVSPVVPAAATVETLRFTSNLVNPGCLPLNLLTPAGIDKC